MADGSEAGSPEHRKAAASFWADLDTALKKIQPPSHAPSSKEDERARAEREFLDSEMQKLHMREEAARVRGVEDYLENRRRYTSRIFWLMVAWMAAVILIVIAYGINAPPKDSPALAMPHTDWVVVVLLLATLAMGLALLVSRGPLDRLTAMGRDRNWMTSWRAWVMIATWTAFPVVSLATICIRPIGRRACDTQQSEAVPLVAWVIAFELPENVVLALIGSTTANVIGIFLIVVKFLFPGQKKRGD